jgi:hypothetical protein
MLKLTVLKDKYAIYRLDPESDELDWKYSSDFYSVTRTRDELSIVCRQIDTISGACEINRDWRILKIEGPLDLSAIGIIAEISGILKENKISIFIISTFETDYILVKNEDLDKAIDSLQAHTYKTTNEI